MLCFTAWLFLVSGFTDSHLGYALEPPAGYTKAHYSDSDGASWTSPDGLVELRILVLALLPTEDPQKTIDEVVEKLSLKELSRAIFTEEQLGQSHARSGIWIDVEADAGSKRMRGLLCIMAGAGRMIMAMGITPLGMWEAYEEELTASLRSLRFITSGG